MIRRVIDALLAALLAPPCAVCKRVLEKPLSGAVCDHCWVALGASALPLQASAITRGIAIGEYDGILRDIIHALKYDGRRSAARRLAALMAQHGSDVLAGADGVVPVPLHRRRQRERGFNQAEDLARGLEAPVIGVLRRTRATDPQVGLPASVRQQNVSRAFSVIDRSTAEGKILVLVDDVTTTGATLTECARALKRAGAHEVRALTAARVSTALR